MVPGIHIQQLRQMFQLMVENIGDKNPKSWDATNCQVKKCGKPQCVSGRMVNPKMAWPASKAKLGSSTPGAAPFRQHLASLPAGWGRGGRVSKAGAEGLVS